MKSKFIIIILVLSIFSSCKKTEVKGTVYSKHNIPIPNASVLLYNHLDQSNFSKPDKVAVTTDNNGNYYFSFRSKRNYGYTVQCENDSGKAWEPIKEKHVNIIDLHLN